MRLFTCTILGASLLASIAGCGSTGTATAEPASTRLFMDVHRLGPGNVTAAAVADAHQKDLAVQAKHGVSFERYWVDESRGLVYCLAEADDPNDVVAAHREAHGLVPDEVMEVVEGR